MRQARWTDRIAILTWILFPIAASAEEWPVYYDFVENGRLQGGRLTIDPANPLHRADFGLDDPTAVPRGWAVTTIVDNGPTANRIDLVFLGDGYTAAQLGAYASHVNNVRTSFMAQEPLAAYASYFNLHRVDVVSNESGVDEPDFGVFRDTALDMTYNCANIERLLCISIPKAVAAAAVAPDVDQTLALANSTRYGGAGYPANDLGTLAGNNGLAVEIALHEFGHSFADLADEYDYGDGATYAGGEPFDANVSIYTAAVQLAEQRKWFRWMNLSNVDTFEGAAYNQFGIYRPTIDSKMRSLGRPFEQVNVEQFVLSMYQTVSPIDDATPPSAQPLPDGTTFFVTPMQPADHSLSVQWSYDGMPVAGATQPTFTPDYPSLVPGIHLVSVIVVDGTARVRDESARAAWMTASRQWSVRVLPRDCNGNGLPDLDDIALGTSGDCNGNSIPDECLPFEQDCNVNLVPDECDIAAATSADCDGNVTPDECEVAALDCNLNGLPDPCDIAGPTSEDCQANGVPDECDIAAVTSQDCNATTIPDECELTANDCNANATPDECELAAADCNANAVIDACDIAASNAIYDCNANGRPDGCDVTLQTSGDCNSNAIPDECDFTACLSLWDGFEPAPPFTGGTAIHGVDYNGDGMAWQNQSGTATIGNQGCPASTGKALKTVALVPPTVDAVISEHFLSTIGGPDDGAPAWSLSFDARTEASLNPRSDWQLSLRDRVTGAAAILIHWASTQSSFAGVTAAQGGNGRGRLLVQNPAGSPTFINTGHVLALNTCYSIRVELNNLTNEVMLYVNGVLRASIPKLQSAAYRLDYFRLEQRPNGQTTGNINRLALDNFTLCRSGGTLAPGGLADCDLNGVWDACDVAGGTAPDCNANLRPDSCDAPADYDGDGRLDLSDFTELALCLTGPCPAPPCAPALYTDPCCALGDADSDGDIDLPDQGAFQADYAAP